jgi:hypothetical protein
VRKVTSSRQGIVVRSLLTLTLVFSLLFATASSVFAAGVGTIQPAGGTITFGGGDVTVKAPDGATTTAVDVTYEALTSSTAPAAAPSGLAFGSQIFSLTAAGDVTFKQFVEVTVKYTAADKATAGGRDDNVALYTYDAAGGSWIEIASALPNVIGQTFTLSQLTLGTYALVLDAGTAPVDTTTSPDTGGFGVTTSMMLAMGLVGAFFVLGGGFIVARGRNN